MDYYIFKGDLRAYLKRKGALKPIIAVKFALDIARSVRSYPNTNLGRNKFLVILFLKSSLRNKHYPFYIDMQIEINICYICNILMYILQGNELFA